MRMIIKPISALETERLILSPFREDDAQALFKNYGTDKNVTKYMLWNNFKSIDDAKNSINYYINCYKNNTNFRQYAIVIKSNNELIGQISFDLNKKHCHADITYLIATQYQNNGYMTEALSKLIIYLFDDLKCKRIGAEVMIDNTASINLLKKCGFTQEGIARSKYINKSGEFTDVVSMAMINDNYR